MMLASTIAGESNAAVSLVSGSTLLTECFVSDRIRCGYDDHHEPYLVDPDTSSHTRGRRGTSPHLFQACTSLSNALPPSHSQQDPAQGERKVVKKKPGMLQAAREIIGEKGITVSIEKVIAAEARFILNVSNLCTGIMARDRTCLGPGDQPCPTSQYQ
jgi:hypothetical protein